jgi:hypothetical protein
MLGFACTKVNISLYRSRGKLNRRFADCTVGIEFDVHAQLEC